MISEHDRQILEALLAGIRLATLLNSAAPGKNWRSSTIAISRAIGALEQNIELCPGLRADIAVPKGAGPHPVVIYLHGGGWSFGSPASYRGLGFQFAAAGHLTINLDYRLAPEHPFPAALEDTVFAIEWATDNARRWNGDGRRIAIGGDFSAAEPGGRRARLDHARATLACASGMCCFTASTISGRLRRAPNPLPDCNGS